MINVYLRIDGAYENFHNEVIYIWEIVKHS